MSLIVFLLLSMFLTFSVRGADNKKMTEPAIETVSLPSVILNAEIQELSTGKPSPAGQTAGGQLTLSASQPAPFKSDVLHSHIQGEFINDSHGLFDTDRMTNSVDSIFLPKRLSLGEQFPLIERDFLSNEPDTGVMQWSAINNTGWFPPDTIIAVGPSHIVQAVNSGFAIYTKAGSEVQGYTTFNSFMPKPVEFQGSMFDPRVIYDPDRKRFLMLVIGKDNLKIKSYVWIAVSSTADPTKEWCRWRWDVTDTSGSSAAWIDYAALGVDRWGVYITGNFFYFNGSYRGAYLKTINPDIFSSDCSGGTNGWVWNNLKWPSGGKAFTLQPAHPHSINEDEQTFFVNSHPNSGNQVLLWKLSGDRTESPTLTKTVINTPVYNSIGENVVQKETSKRLDGGDTRIMNAVYSDKHVFYTQTTDVFNDGNQAGWLTVKLSTKNNSKEWDALLWSEGNYYFYPALTLNGAGANNKLAIFGSWSSFDQYVSGIVKIYEDQPNNTDGPLVNFKSGANPYFRLSGGRNRWGDYSGASYDWTCGFAWGAVEITDINNQWDTVITAQAFNNKDISCLEPIKHTLTVNKTGSGNGIVVSDPVGFDCNEGCSNDYGVGQSITLTATANSTSRFIGWGDENHCHEGESEVGICTVTMDDSLIVTALFESICELDDFEPDNSRGTAHSLLSGTPQNHSFCPGTDEDWVTFTLVDAEAMTLEVTGNKGNISLELYDDGFNLINSSPTKNALIEYTCQVTPLLGGGTYYVKVNEIDKEVVDEYVLSLNTEQCKNKLGDANGDGIIDVLDIVKSINIVLMAGAPVFGADCDENGNVNIQDIICTINSVLNSHN